jgi:small conductance mechanosensitive channel
MDQPIETLDQTQEYLVRMALEFGPRVLSALLILVAGCFVMVWTARMGERGLQRFALEPPVRDLLIRVLKVLVLGVFLLMALQNLGIELLPLIAGLGIAGAGVALALQGVLGNIVAGLSIIFTKPFRVGQYISIAGEEGAVQSISLFSTVLRHSDLSEVVIPNRKIAGEILHNYGEIRQLSQTVVITYESDVERAITAIREVLDSNSRVLQDPAPLVQAVSLGEFGVIIAIRPWAAVRDFGAMPGEITPAILQAFREQGITIATPPAKTRSGP